MTEWEPTIEKSGKPHYLAIADAIADDVKSGVLSAGDRLPPNASLPSGSGLISPQSQGLTQRRRRADWSVATSVAAPSCWAALPTPICPTQPVLLKKISR